MSSFLRFSFILVILNFSIHISGQEQTLKFQNIQEGLSGKFIRCIEKDLRSYMWFGSYNGLNRYDGSSIISYEHDPDDSNSINHNVINAILETSDGNLWIATAEGLCKYNRSDDNFSSLPHLNYYLTYLFEDSRGNLWIGTISNGLYVFNQSINKLEQYQFPDINEEITCITEYSGKYLLIGTHRGILIFNTNEKTFSPDRHLSNIDVAGFSSCTDGNLGVVSANGKIFKYGSTIEEIVIPELQHGRVLSFICDENKLYIGRENEGLAIIQLPEKQTYFYKNKTGDNNSLASNSIWSLYLDKHDGKIWIGTFNKGVCLVDEFFMKFPGFQNNPFDNQSLADDDVKCFLQDSNGLLWIGTDGGGISIFNEEQENFINRINTGSNPKISSNSISCLSQGKGNSVWIGHWAAGIDQLIDNKVFHYPIMDDQGRQCNLLCIYNDKNGNIWAGTAGKGLYFLDNTKNKFLNIPSIPQHAYVTSILEDNLGNIWVGTLFGLYACRIINNELVVSFTYLRDRKSGSISSNQITCIHSDRFNNLWIGTNDNGLNQFNYRDNNFKAFTKKDGISSNTINGILSDLSGNLWVSSGKGLSHINPEKSIIENYSKADGLLTEGFYLGSCFQSKKFFYFGGDAGFHMINADSIILNPIPLVMEFTNININNGQRIPISEKNAMTLNHDASSITFEFSGIGYTRTSANRYEFLMEGLNDNWENIGNQSYISFSNLKEGRYKLLVRGYNNDGLISQFPAKIEIRIKPPLWKTWWAIILYILISLAISYYIYRIRMERLRMKNSLALERITREKEHELNQAKLQFFTNVSHELRTPLTLILSPVENLIDSKLSGTALNQIKIIRKNVSRLINLVNEIMDFRKIEDRRMHLSVRPHNALDLISEYMSYFQETASKRHIHFKYKPGTDKIIAWLDETKFEKIITNLLSNSFKYTPDNGMISIEVKSIETDTLVKGKWLQIAVMDNGSGIPQEDLPYIFERFYQSKKSRGTGTGIGLTIVKNMVELHHGTINVESEPGNTIFRFTIPIDSEAYSEEEISTVPPVIIENHQQIEQFDSTLEQTDIQDITVLLAEDDQELSDYITQELGNEFRIITASNGQKALEIVINILPDIIVSDVMMPGINGYELCKTIKTDKRISHIPFIMLTARASVEDQVKGLEEGADVYITKPFNVQVLVAQIRQILQRRKELYAQYSQEVRIMPSMFAHNRLDRDFLDGVLSYIITNLDDNQLGVESLAENLNFSRGQIYKKIKSLTGKTAVEFIREVRLKEALKLMETRKYSLAEIAYMTGFNSASYFTRSFKDVYGKAPSEYLDTN